jgi:GT2 family glycosyltransferase
MKPTASIIIPTFNNAEYLNPCIESIIRSGVLTGLCELIIVNNGVQPIKEIVKGWPNTTVLEPGKNLGWEGGLALGVQHAKGDFFCFQNDDTLIPKATQSFYSQLLWPFQDLSVGAVGPATTVAAGWHSVYSPSAFRMLTEVSFLIFFTVMVRRSDYEALGGIDTQCPGGDDLDLSIRMRKAGKKLLVNPDAFIIHHAFKTGERVRGDSSKPGGWNSKEMTERTNRYLIQKHGFKTYLETMRGLQPVGFPSYSDVEGEAVSSLVRGPKIVELGCGFRKTVPQAVGIDQVGNGDNCAHLMTAEKCVADIQADVTKPLPVEPEYFDTAIARHILEHCVDSVQTIKNWNAAIKMGGRLIIAVPNQEWRNTIPLNPEHVHAFTPDSLMSLGESCGFKLTHVVDPGNKIAFVACFEKTESMGKVAERKEGELVNA